MDAVHFTIWWEVMFWATMIKKSMVMLSNQISTAQVEQMLLGLELRFDRKYMELRGIVAHEASR